MKPFEQLCEEIRDFALAHPDEHDAVISDHAVYGAGMDASIAIAKLNALSAYARKEWRLTLYIENRTDEEIHQRPRHGPAPFRDWLLKQVAREDAIGDLARDVAQDDDGTSELLTRRAWLSYLTARDACDGAVVALRRAWDEHRETLVAR